MRKESIILNFLDSNEKSFRIKGMPTALPEPQERISAWIVTELDGKDIAALLEQEVQKSRPIKRIVAQASGNQAYLRGWLKNNGYIIYGEELIRDDDNSFCETTAAVLEGLANEYEVSESNKGLHAEVFIYGNEELYNEISPLLRVYNNVVLPELLYSKIAQAEKIVFKINEIEPDDSKLPPDLYEKKHKALSAIQQLGIMGNTMYPID